MTRINLIPPRVLADQHLLAEWREIKMIPAALRNSLKTKSVEQVLSEIPEQFVLGKGHVKFFYDKQTYLVHRYEELTAELLKRKYNLYHTGTFLDFCHDAPDEFFNGYAPDADALNLIHARIADKIQKNPGWYKYYGGEYKDTIIGYSLEVTFSQVFPLLLAK